MSGAHPDTSDDRTMLACKACRASIVSRSSVITEDGFRGYHGKAALVTDAPNTSPAAPSIMLMDTGAHTIAELACASCAAYLGWRVLRAHELSEKWKEGRCILELALLAPLPLRPLPTPVPRPSSAPSATTPAPPPASSPTQHSLPSPVDTPEPLPLPVPSPPPPPLPPLTQERESAQRARIANAMPVLGHRRTATDPHALRGRPHGPRSITPSLRRADRTLSVVS
ncbi:hypothetical protein IEO21_06583 [Rhodonia placenta]|uniref:Yippee domain-containing protein n=1 Tax=Rhodonia placenta TaxID=104341 RepID=A0A8H7NZT6_9APHY|nr:hypothetical protein IEO21_06583 [Postia placenta]